MSNTAADDFRTWYSARRSVYEQLARAAEDILTRLLPPAHIQVLSVSSRAKSVESAAEKVNRKGYSDPAREMSDLAAVRVITFVESDLERVTEVVEGAFHVIREKSSDKSEGLGVDRAGYRSLHFVCDLGVDRLKLPEFSIFRGHVFEVQVRTAFQHAWAEVEHNRRYKFAGVLPVKLQRRLNLLAGMLEIADRELASIAADVDEYASSVTRLAKAGELEVEINSTSVYAYLEEKLGRSPDVQLVMVGIEPIPAVVIAELRDFQLNTLADLNSIFPDEVVALLQEYLPQNSHMGLLRDAMMYADLDRYFRDAWKNHWQATEPPTVDFLAAKYDRTHILSVFRKYKIGIHDEYDIYDETDDEDAEEDVDV